MLLKTHLEKIFLLKTLRAKTLSNGFDQHSYFRVWLGYEKCFEGNKFISSFEPGWSDLSK